MIVNYYSVYDKKSVSFGNLFPAPTHGTAERNVSEAMTPDSQFRKYSSDFALYHHGTFDTESGIFEHVVPPLLLVELSSL